MLPKLSIIIPFYNVEQYIAQCLDSVYRQDIPEEEYEVICVNDASPDHSRDIVLEYQKQHKNLVLIEHEHNKKLGAARNTGRSIARGKYIWNVDSDDYIADNCLKSILDQCESNELDILMFNLAEFTDTDLKAVDFPFSSCDEVIDGLTCLNNNIPHIGRFCPVWRYVYSKEFLDRNSIYSPEINMGEDVPYAFKSIILANRVMLVDEVHYYYRINPASLTGVKVLPPKVLYEKCFFAARLVYDLLGLLPQKYIELKTVFSNMVRYIVQIFPEYLHKMSKAEKKQFAAICRKHFFENIYLFQLMSKQVKVHYINMLLNKYSCHK